VDLTIEKLFLIVVGFLIFGLLCKFLADNKALWQRPRQRGPNDPNYQEIPKGKK